MLVIYWFYLGVPMNYAFGRLLQRRWVGDPWVVAEFHIRASKRFVSVTPVVEKGKLIEVS